MKIYQVIYARETGEDYTMYVGTERAEAFRHEGDNVKIKVWIFGTDVEHYVYENGDWSLKFTVADVLEEKTLELANEKKELDQKLANISEEWNQNKLLLDILKAK